jgi:hypothetical protein
MRCTLCGCFFSVSFGFAMTANRATEAYRRSAHFIPDGVELDSWGVPIRSPIADPPPNDWCAFTRTTFPNRHAFVDDYRFESLWRRGVPVPGVVTTEPDFSVFSDSPMAWVLFQVYRSRLMGSWAEASGGLCYPVLQFGSLGARPAVVAGLQADSWVCARAPGPRGVEVRRWVYALLQSLDVCPMRVCVFGVFSRVADDLERNGVQWAGRHLNGGQRRRVSAS